MRLQVSILTHTRLDDVLLRIKQHILPKEIRDVILFTNVCGPDEW